MQQADLRLELVKLVYRHGQQPEQTVKIAQTLEAYVSKEPAKPKNEPLKLKR